MHRPESPQPAGHLISRALAEAGMYTKLRCPTGDCTVVGINDCNDDRTYWNKLRKIMTTLNPDDDERCVPLPVPHFGGLIAASPHCPGYSRSESRAFLKQLRIAVQKRGVRIFFGGAHGEHCGFCAEEGITVAQRHWLSQDAKFAILRTAEVEQWTAPNDEIQVCLTWHRRYMKDGREHQKTRVIGSRHPLFAELPIRQVMLLNDLQVLHVVAPNLLELAEA